MSRIFLVAALMSIVSLALIIIFMFTNGLPVILKYGFDEFLFGTTWRPTVTEPKFGLLPMILGSMYVTLGAAFFGVPVGILTAVFMAEYCPKWLYKILKPAISLMAAIPSIVYGFFALQLLVPVVRDYLGGNGYSMLTAMLLLGIMILPTVIELTEAAIRAVPTTYYEGSIALGATHERSIFTVVVPAARSGVLSSMVLGIGRAIGETMAVVLIAGNQPIVPNGLLTGVRTLTTNIVLEMSYASGDHRQALIATGVILFVFILLINSIFIYMKEREMK
ncbi:MAG: phosphate ABC transporter permease subunit PstC [Atopostipes suicloacalis]|nr:phosphate ABC transporter permease subunit PstC [Atopostipes suicloacalis]